MLSSVSEIGNIKERVRFKESEIFGKGILESEIFGKGILESEIFIEIFIEIFTEWDSSIFIE